MPRVAERIAWSEFALLDEAGFTSFEKRTLVALMLHGVADAATLCREGEVPTSKVYAATQRLARLGLLEIRETRPRLYAALPAELVVERLKGIAAERAERFARDADRLEAAFARLPRRIESRSVRVDVALGVEGHLKRHVARIASCRATVRSYLEGPDLAALSSGRALGFDVLKAIARRQDRSRFDHRAIFGFTHRNAPRLAAFLADHAAVLGAMTGIRYSGEIGRPFHVIDDDAVIVALDHPFVGEGRFASLYIEDASLAGEFASGFDALWKKALVDLREMRHWPARAPAESDA